MNKLVRSFRALLTGVLSAMVLLFVTNASAITFSDSSMSPGFFGNSQSFSSASASDLFSLTYTSTGVPYFGVGIFDSGLTTIYQNFPSFGNAPINQTFSLAPGFYQLAFFGLAQSGASFNLALNVTPVPEASEWAMMLVGLCMIGFIIRRRMPV